MKLKDFKIGQEVHIVDLNTGRRQEPYIYNGIVSKVGRIYLTLDNDNRYEEWEGCFREYKDWGETTYLFQTRQQAKDFIEKRELERFFRCGIIDYGKCTLEQLRSAKKILQL